MAKKIMGLVLALMMMLTFAGCGKSDNNLEANYEGKLDELMTAIYEQTPVELNLAPPTAIDITNADNVSYFLGLSDGKDIEEAVVSEPMIGSQAYSLCLIRAKEGADVSALKQEILKGIDLRKWICVGADKAIVSNYKDVMIMIMTDSGLSATLTDDLFEGFSTAVGGNTGEKLERTE